MNSDRYELIERQIRGASPEGSLAGVAERPQALIVEASDSASRGLL